MNMNFENMDQLFEDALNHLEIKPNAKVKANVKKGVFLYNLFRNIYFQSSIGLLLVSIAIIFAWQVVSPEMGDQKLAFTKTNERVDQSNEIDIKNETENVAIEHESNHSKSIENTNILTDEKTENKEELETDLYKANPSDNKKSNKNIWIEDEKEETVVNNILTNAEQNTTSAQPSEKENASALQIDPKPSDKQIEDISYLSTEIGNRDATFSNVSDEENQILTKQADEINYSDHLDIYAESEYSSEVNQKYSSSQNYKFIQQMPLKTWNYIFNLEYPSLDTYPLFEDTLGFNIIGQPIVVSSKIWHLSALVSPNYSLSRFVNQSTENEKNTQANQLALSSKMNFGFGLELSYQFKQLELGGGFAYQQYAQDFEANQENVVLNNIDYWNYFEQDIWQIDSVPIFNLDSLLQGDSTAFVIVFDSTQSTVQDSSLESRIDTSYTKELVKKRNLYKYFEIPLFVQYNFNKGRKFQPFVRLGWVTGLYFRTEGSYVNGSNRVSDLNEAPFIKVSFWANAGLGFSYRYTKHWHAIAFVNYRYNINGIIQRQDYYNQHLDYINFSLGLRYGF